MTLRALMLSRLRKLICGEEIMTNKQKKVLEEIYTWIRQAESIKFLSTHERYQLERLKFLLAFAEELRQALAHISGTVADSEQHFRPGICEQCAKARVLLSGTIAARKMSDDYR